jgi:nucleotide-binding universal stress UspA family protein
MIATKGSWPTMKNILVPMTGFENDVRAMQAASSIGASFAANVVCLRVSPDPMQIIAQAALSQFGSAMGNVQLIHAIEEEGRNRTIAARKAFDEFSERVSFPAGALPGGAITVSWQEIEGDPVADTIVAARYSDLIVLGRAPKDGAFDPDSIAMPLLSHAKRIAVISANETASTSPKDLGPAARLAEQLAHHGFSPDVRGVTIVEQPVSKLLIQAAHEFGADLLVMGAYSHSRFRELVFGGFTRQVLLACDLPVLLLH